MNNSLPIRLLALTVLICIAGCGGPPKTKLEIVWPDEPLPTRVRYVSTFHGSQDLKRGFLGGVKDFFFGRQAGMNINKPYGIACDGSGKLYVAETADKSIQVYDLNAGSTKILKKISSRKTLLEPVYVILDDLGRIFVSDTELKRVVVFNADHSFSHFIGGNGKFEAPVGMAIDEARGRLYVVDTRQHDIKVFTLEGEQIQTIGKRGDQQGEFYFPTTIAVGPNGKLYVVDSFHFAVQVFDTMGVYLSSFGPTKSGPGMMARPRDIALDSEANLYITDATRNNVQIYDSSGNLLLVFGQTGVEPGEFQLPAGLCISKENQIYVADSINRRIQVFEYVTNVADEGSD